MLAEMSNAETWVLVIGALLGGGGLATLFNYIIQRRTTRVSEGEFGFKVLKGVIETLQSRVTSLEAEVTQLEAKLGAEELKRRVLENEVHQLRLEVGRT